jgi:hypothetical protein
VQEDRPATSLEHPGTTTAKDRAQWSSEPAFIFAMAAAAVGLGNIWRFPYLVGEYGGGGFILAYIVAMVVVCLPLMYLEVAAGRLAQGNTVHTFRRVQRTGAWYGWFVVGLTAVITSYYLVDDSRPTSPADVPRSRGLPAPAPGPGTQRARPRGVEGLHRSRPCDPGVSGREVAAAHVARAEPRRPAEPPRPIPRQGRLHAHGARCLWPRRPEQIRDHPRRTAR